MSKSISEVTAELENFVGNINRDLQISTSSKLFDPSPFQKAATALSGLAFISGGPFSGFTSRTLEHERLVAEIAIIANVPVDEVKDFYQTHSYSLEFIRAAIQAGAKLDEEDIKKRMEEQVKYSFGWSSFPTPIEMALTRLEEQHTFIVTFPNGDRREVKATYMEIDGGTLYFEDENRETILAFGLGHWVWSERVEDDTQP